MARYILKRKLYTIWDETDNLKRMKDSDILAENKRSMGYGRIAGAAVGGAALGAATVGGIGAIRGIGNGGAWKGLKGGAAGGALVGAAAGAGLSYLRNRRKVKENKFYNKRLQFAKGQALRRERKDWITNMTQRDGYSY
jgi:hypothetical protein